MNRARLFCACCFLCLESAVGLAQAQISIKDTTVPNRFWFSHATYVAPAGAESVEIAVLFQPGNRGFSGSVNYYTQDDTASEGVEYETATGRLSYAGVTVQKFEIRIVSTTSNIEPKTLRVCLSNEQGELVDTATVVIDVAPRLTVSLSAGSLVISWPTAFANYSLEQCGSCDFANPKPISTPAAIVDGQFRIERSPSSSILFYRLVKR